MADFELPDQDAVPRRLSTFLANGPVVLFFYPAAMSYGCTKESCSFRDHAKEFADLKATRVGISRDSVAKQREFSAAHGLDYPLLSDESGSIAEAFGVKRAFGPLPTRRWTFVINQDSTVRAVIKNEVSMGHHVDAALASLRANP